MINCIKRTFLGFLLLLVFVPEYSAQDRDISLFWQQNELKTGKESIESTQLWFKDAVPSLQEPKLPLFHTMIRLNPAADEIDIALRNPRFEVIESAEWMTDELIPSEIAVEGELVNLRGKMVARISVNPLVKRKNGQIERLLSGTIHVEVLKNKSVNRSVVEFAEHSKLATGSWFRIPISQTGVYKLSRAYFLQLGVDVANIDPATINIYGNDAGMMAHSNADYVYDDLIQKAIYFEGEADGSFDGGDHILFYAKGPHSWTYNANDDEFRHTKNLLSDVAYCFIGIGVDPPKRVTDYVAPDVAADYEVSSFDDHRFHEVDLESIIKSGSRMVGEKFGLNQTLTYNGGAFNYENIDTSSPAKIRLRGVTEASGSSNVSQITFGTQGETESINLSGTSGYTVTRAAERVLNFTPDALAPNPGNLGLTVEFSPGSSDAKGWVDFISVNVRRELLRTNAQTNYRDVQAVLNGNVAEYTIGNMAQGQRVWDVTDGAEVTEVSFELDGTIATYKSGSDVLREYVLFNVNNAFLPENAVAIANQDLHGAEQYDMVILTATPFRSTAEKVADFHREDGLSVVVLEPQPLYNEFSCGMQDIMALRMYMKMLYDRAGSDIDAMPDYLLLIGDGNYDHTAIAPSGSIYLPSFQSLESNSLTGSYITDDFFGHLDDNESGPFGGLDIGIGRFPVRNTADAEGIYNKIVRYKAEHTGVVGGQCNPEAQSSFGDWKNKVLLVGDDEDDNRYMNQSNQLGGFLLNNDEDYILNKVFLDAYVQEVTPGGARYPQAAEEIKRAIENGVFLVSYTGHGGEVGWAAERIIDVPTIQGFTNSNSLPLLLTATCEFSRYDDPGRTSAGEFTLLNPNGGVIALLTTTRLVFSNENFDLATNFFNVVMLKDAETYSCDGIDFNFSNGLRLGDIMRVSKNCTGGSNTNKANFSILGDPALRLSYPEHRIVTDSIVDVNGNSISTMKALQRVKVYGKVVSEGAPGVPLTDFNGEVSPSLYDKSVDVETLSNDGGAVFGFTSRKNVLYKGRASVTQGMFEYEFIVPKDISYTTGNGKVFYYGVSDNTDAQGSYDDFLIGGTDSTAVADAVGPSIDLYLDSEAFVDGGMTNESPVLIAKLFDENGVNTAGNGIGHDITAVLDGRTADPIVLNDYFSLDLDSYQRGELRYQLEGLAEGEHTLKFKVWDIYNNSSTIEIAFKVRSDVDLSLDNVLNYPNPFTTRTEFLFEHNQPACDALDVHVQVFTVSGKLVKTIHRTVDAHKSMRDQVTWDGRDDYGDRLGRGVYVYKLKVVTPQGEKEEVIEKLVLL